MKNVLIEASEDTPKVEFDSIENIFSISGRSYPDDVVAVYNSAFEWLNANSNSFIDNTKLELKLDYFNTASAKILYDIISIFDKLGQAGKKIKINWYYKIDDEEMLEAGEGFKNIIDTPIEIMPY